MGEMGKWMGCNNCDGVCTAGGGKLPCTPAIFHATTHFSNINTHPDPASARLSLLTPPSATLSRHCSPVL